MRDEKKYVPFFGCMISVKYPQFEAAVRKTMPKVGMSLVDLEGFTCCPDPIYFKSSDKLTWLTIAARNLCIAEEAGLDVITMCSGCTATLSETRYHLAHDEELKSRVNQRLKRIGKEYRGTGSVRHIVTVLRDDIGLDTVAASVVKPLEGLRVAVHYGCHLLKPSEIMRVDDPDRPTILERLLETIGAEPVHHDANLLCCGKACMEPDMPAQMTYDILSSIKKTDVDCMGLICPTCFDAYDLGQIKLARQFQTRFDIPVIYYFQLLGLAQGLSPGQMGLHLHKIRPELMLAKVA